MFGPDPTFSSAISPGPAEPLRHQTGWTGLAALAAAALAIATLPGATLWHEGQFDGRRVRLPVFLAMRPAEPLDLELRRFHLDLLAGCACRGPTFRAGPG